jgi:hypothetical protein
MCRRSPGSLATFTLALHAVARAGCSPAPSTARVEAFRTGAAITRARPELRRRMNFGTNFGTWIPEIRAALLD